jgi:hypothetical protein
LVALFAVSSADEPPTDERASSSAGVGRSDAPEQAASATLAGETDDGVVELVSTETDDVLTVEAVDNPDATISSDTWEPVEQ